MGVYPNNYRLTDFHSYDDLTLNITLDVWCSGLNSLKSNKDTYAMILVYSATSSN